MATLLELMDGLKNISEKKKCKKKSKKKILESTMVECMDCGYEYNSDIHDACPKCGSRRTVDKMKESEYTIDSLEAIIEMVEHNSLLEIEMDELTETIEKIFNNVLDESKMNKAHEDNY